MITETKRRAGESRRVLLSNFIRVEDIDAAISEATKKPIYQEALTELLADNLGCMVVTHGTHQRFRTECRASPDNVGPLPGERE